MGKAVTKVPEENSTVLIMYVKNIYAEYKNWQGLPCWSVAKTLYSQSRETELSSTEIKRGRVGDGGVVVSALDKLVESAGDRGEVGPRDGPAQ